MRRRKSKVNSTPGRIRIVPLNELRLIREQLEKVSQPGTDMREQASVISWAMQYQGCYYQTPHGLRRVFPKAAEVVLFHGVPQSKSGELLSNFSGGQDAANQPEADAVPDQQ